jgi:hypothetical protein
MRTVDGEGRACTRRATVAIDEEGSKGNIRHARYSTKKMLYAGSFVDCSTTVFKNGRMVYKSSVDAPWDEIVPVACGGETSSGVAPVQLMDLGTLTADANCSSTFGELEARGCGTHAGRFTVAQLRQGSKQNLPLPPLCQYSIMLPQFDAACKL